MKIYNKPEIEIVEFDIAESVTQEIDDSFGGVMLNTDGDEVFLGETEGYIVE